MILARTVTTDSLVTLIHHAMDMLNVVDSLMDVASVAKDAASVAKDERRI